MSEVTEKSDDAVVSQPIPSLQGGWRRCTRCQSFFFGGFSDPGACPAGGRHTAGNVPYAMLYDGRGSVLLQHDWKSCSKCRGLYYGGFPAQGPCPAGGSHLPTGSLAYTVPFGQPIVQNAEHQWTACFDCNTLYFGPSQGVCVAGGAHNPTRSFDYSVWIDV